MKKFTWGIILAITSVVTVFSFGCMWAVKPDSPAGEYADKVFEEAKARQSEYIINVQEPLDTDVEAMSAEEEMAQRVTQLLMDNDSFIKDLADAVFENYKASIGEWEESFATDTRDKMEKAIAEALATANEKTESSVKALSDEIDTKLDTLERGVDARLARVDGSLSSIESQIIVAEKDAKEYIDQSSATLSENIERVEEEGKAADQAIYENLEDIKDENALLSEHLSKEIADAEKRANVYTDYVDSKTRSYIDNAVAAIPEKEEKVEVLPPMEIERELQLLGYPVYAKAYSGHAQLEFPEFVTSSELNSGIKLFLDDYPEVAAVAAFVANGSDIIVVYPQDTPESVIEEGLDIIEYVLANYTLPEPEKKPEVEPPKESAIEEELPVEPAKDVEVTEPPVEDVKPVEPVEVVDYDYKITRSIPLFGDSVLVSAYSDRVEARFPSFVTGDDIADGAVMLIQAYPEETAIMDFSVDDGAILIGYGEQYTKETVNMLLDAVVSFFSNVDFTKEVEQEEIIEEIKEEKPIVPALHIEREIPLLTSTVKVDAYDGSATIILPEFVTTEDITAGINRIYTAFPSVDGMIGFAPNGRSVNVSYPEGRTDAEINSWIDALEALLDEMTAVPVIKVPSKPMLSVSVMPTTPSSPSFESVSSVLVDDTPAMPTVLSVDKELSPELTEDMIPEIRNSIRNIEVERYLNIAENATL